MSKSVDARDGWEQWFPRNARRAPDGLFVFVTRGRRFRLSHTAYEALGCPSDVVLDTNRQTRMARIRGTPEQTQASFKVAEDRSFAGEGLLRWARVPVGVHKIPAERQGEGVLVFPLPEAEPEHGGDDEPA